MIPLGEFVTLAVVHLFAIASPGPNVIASITNSIVHGQRAGITTSLGIAVGNLFHIGLGIFGITILITRYPQIGIFISILGVFYLAYLGITKIRNGLMQKKGTELESGAIRSENFFLSGVMINLTNLKGALFFLVAFSTLIPVSQTLEVKIFYGFWMAIVNFLFLSGLAWLFGRRKMVAHRFKHEGTMNVVGGSVYLIVALLIFYSAVKTFTIW